MSHLRTCKIQLKQLDEQLTLEAMKEIAAKVNGEIVQVVEDYYRNKVNVIAGVKAPGIRGFGVTVEKGQVKIIGDDYGNKLKLQDFAGLFQRTYTAIAVKKSLTQLGYSVSSKEEAKTIYVYGVRV